jgi:hypothetical protein
MREEIERLDLSSRLTPETRRLLTNRAKIARKQGKNPRHEVSRALTELMNKK